MQKFTFHRDRTGLFSEQQNRLVYRQEELMSFLHVPFELHSFEQQIKRKVFSKEQRELLVNVIQRQYKDRTYDPAVQRNIEKLGDQTTFTVTTGHQIPVFTGPLFFIYKVLHAIRLAEELNSKQDEHHFVPVYWMATEDHDFEEVKWVDLFGKTISWESDQTGPVGRFELNGFEAIKEEFASFFSGEALEEIRSILDIYNGSDFADATFNLVNRLFGKYGLIILNADDRQLKSSFAPILKREIESGFSHAAVERTNQLLEREGMKLQVHAREINLFYLEKGLRERIIHLEDGFFVEGKGKFTKAEMLKLIEDSPECISPNVILRPVYQEFILPNLCYIGGVGEIAYWLQLKGVFEAVNVQYPLLSVRNSVLWIDPVNSKKIAKTELLLEDLFHDAEELKRQYVLRNQDAELDMNDVERSFTELSEILTEKVISVDPGLEKFIASELVKMDKQIASVKDKIYKSVKSRHDQSLVAIDQIKSKLFPNNGLQERSTNLFQLCAGGKVEERIAQLHEIIDPFEKDFIVVRES